MSVSLWKTLFKSVIVIFKVLEGNIFRLASYLPVRRLQKITSNINEKSKHKKLKADGN